MLVTFLAVTVLLIKRLSANARITTASAKETIISTKVKPRFARRRFHIESSFMRASFMEQSARL
jgi:hypothetical protein